MLSAPRMNLTSANYNVPEVEWRIRLVKEIIRATIHIINFHRIPNLMRTHAILSIGKILNYFTTKVGVSTTMNTKAVLNGEYLDYKNHLKLRYGKYYKVHENETLQNIKKSRTQSAICLGLCGNQQGGYHFRSFPTRKKTKKKGWDEIPMTDTVINKFSTLGKDQPEHLNFREIKIRLIGEVELTGLDGEPADTAQQTKTVEENVLFQ